MLYLSQRSTAVTSEVTRRVRDLNSFLLKTSWFSWHTFLRCGATSTLKSPMYTPEMSSFSSVLPPSKRTATLELPVGASSSVTDGRGDGEVVEAMVVEVAVEVAAEMEVAPLATSARGAPCAKLSRSRTMGPSELNSVALACSSSLSMGSAAGALASAAPPFLAFFSFFFFSHAARAFERRSVSIFLSSSSFSGVACLHCRSRCSFAWSGVPAGHRRHRRMSFTHFSGPPPPPLLVAHVWPPGARRGSKPLDAT